VSDSALTALRIPWMAITLPFSCRLMAIVNATEIGAEDDSKTQKPPDLARRKAVSRNGLTGLPDSCWRLPTLGCVLGDYQRRSHKLHSVGTPQPWILGWHRIGFRHFTKERLHFACRHKGNEDATPPITDIRPHVRHLAWCQE
jgi:hypothetical protein